MELNEFVKKTLVDLSSAIEGAKRETSRDIKFQAPKDSPTIEFDIAVTNANAANKEGQAGLKILPILNSSGSISHNTTNSTISRVKFGINVENHKGLDEINRQMFADSPISAWLQ